MSDTSRWRVDVKMDVLVDENSRLRAEGCRLKADLESLIRSYPQSGSPAAWESLDSEWNARNRFGDLKGGFATQTAAVRFAAGMGEGREAK